VNILIASEESQVVTKAFRELGHEAFSCDILEPSGDYPEWHLKQDVIPLLSIGWDLILAFPPCTHLSTSGARWFPEKIKDGRQQRAIDFFMEFVNSPCEHIAIENPVGIMSTIYRKPDQIIQPWQFGHGETKRTCLWLKGLPELKHTDIVEGRSNRIHMMPGNKHQAKRRSKTYDGIAKAFATQWSKYLETI